MKNTILLLFAAGLVSLVAACDSETRKNLSNAKDNISAVSDMVTSAQDVKEETDKLKQLTPLTNDQLKEWLPESVSGLERTGFVVGKTGYMNVASVEGTFKSADGQQFEINVIDGAGETGSILMAGLGMASNMEMEQEDESKHMQTVTLNGIKAKQTYYKKRDDTSIQFVYDERFGVMVNTKDMNPDQTWALIEKVGLNKLSTLAE